MYGMTTRLCPEPRTFPRRFNCARKSWPTTGSSVSSTTSPPDAPISNHGSPTFSTAAATSHRPNSPPTGRTVPCSTAGRPNSSTGSTCCSCPPCPQRHGSRRGRTWQQLCVSGRCRFPTPPSSTTPGTPQSVSPPAWARTACPARYNSSPDTTARTCCSAPHRWSRPPRALCIPLPSPPSPDVTGRRLRRGRDAFRRQAAGFKETGALPGEDLYVHTGGGTAEAAPAALLAEIRMGSGIPDPGIATVAVRVAPYEEGRSPLPSRIGTQLSLCWNSPARPCRSRVLSRACQWRGA